MDPFPDHGEESYRGAGRLEGRKALVTGGDSGIGRAAAIAFAREGADVAICYLPEEEADAKEVIAYRGRGAADDIVGFPVSPIPESSCAPGNPQRCKRSSTQLIATGSTEGRLAYKKPSLEQFLDHSLTSLFHLVFTQ